MTTPFRPRQARRTTTGPSGRGRGANTDGPSRGRHPTARAAATGTRSPGGRRSNAFLVLLGIVSVLVLLGLVMVLSASTVTDLQDHGTAWYSFRRQAVWATAGLIAMVAAMRVDYWKWRRLATPLLIVSIGMLVLVLVPGIGLTRGGATRWLGAGAFVIQPAEVVKLAVVLWGADLLDRRSDRMHISQLTLRPMIVLLGLVSVLLLLQPNQGTLAIIAITVFVLLYAGGAPVLRLGAVFALGTAAAIALSLAVSYRRARLLAFLDPWADPLGNGFQTVQSTVGIASGGLFGVGLGGSKAKWGFLPEAHTDFIFAIVAEELGLVGAFVVLALFAALAVTGIVIARNAPDRFSMLVASGITAWFAFQAVVNIGAATGSLPVTGVPLPFVSFGGSSLLFSMVAVGILLNIARYHGEAPGAAEAGAPSRRERTSATQPRRAVSRRHPAAPVG
jgi:cell division protein FtsW